MKKAALMKILQSIHPDITFDDECDCITVGAPRGFKWAASGAHCLCNGASLPLDAPRRMIREELEKYAYPDLAERAAYGLEECDEGEECEMCHEAA